MLLCPLFCRLTLRWSGCALCCSVLAVAAVGYDSNKGCTYLFLRDKTGSSWTFAKQLLPNVVTNNPEGLFGYSIALWGTKEDLIVVAGAPQKTWDTEADSPGRA